MVAPRLPSHSNKKRRRRGPKQTIDTRLLLIPLLLAALAITWNVVRLFRSLLKPSQIISHREHARDAEFWNYDWCSSNGCQYMLALDLQEFLGQEDEAGAGSLLEEMVPDPQEIRETFELDDDDNNIQKKNNNKSSSLPLTDDLDAHPDHFGNLLINSARFERTPTPRILVEARRNMTFHSRTYGHNNASQHPHLRNQRHAHDHSALLSRRGLGGSHYYNQDRAVLVDPFPVHNKNHHNPLENDFLLGILDGHGLSGHVKADFAASTLPRLLMEQLATQPRVSWAQIQTTFSNVFWQVHRQGPLIHDSGCTASVMVRLQQHLYFANVGDSRSMLIQIERSGTVNITHNTQPHKPNHPKERQRIVRAGCVVIDPEPFRDPTARVADPRDESGMALAMSRSIGDYDLEHCGVTPEPTVTRVDLSSYHHNKPILLAVSITDGIMDALSLEEVAQALAVPFQNNLAQRSAVYASPLELAAEDLIRTASDRWLQNSTFIPYRDDITIAVRRVQ